MPSTEQQRFSDPRLNSLFARKGVPAAPAPAQVRPAQRQGPIVSDRVAAAAAAEKRAPCCPPPVQPPRAPAAPPAEEAARVPEAAPPPTAPAHSSVCSLTVNGKQYTIDPAKGDVDGMTTVHDWIEANVHGARMRRSCGFGYCGACIVMVTYTDPLTHTSVSRSFNSCLRPVLSCNGMAITTAAGVGSLAQPHPVQKALADNSGTQCGMCSVGMVMGLYAHLMGRKGANDSPSELELESILDGHICRCTGYRPILDTYKSFASAEGQRMQSDADKLRRREIFHSGMEERGGADKHQGPVPLPDPRLPARPAPHRSLANGIQWVTVSSEFELRTVLAGFASQAFPPRDVWLVGGRTSQGLYQDRRPDVMIDISGVSSLRQCRKELSGGVSIGASATMTDAIDFLEATAKAHPGAATAHYAAMARHGRLAPGTSIRNMGTLGGNAAIVHEHQHDAVGPFPTEWPVLLEAAGATVEVVDALTGMAFRYSFPEFYSTSLRSKYIRCFHVPAARDGQVFRSFKTGQRARYVHSFLAAAMQCAVGGDGKVEAGSARIVVSGLGRLPSRMTATEQAMEGSLVSDQDNFQTNVIPALDSELNPTGNIGGADYRRSLARGFLYKFYLALQPSLPQRLQSAAQPWLERTGTSSSQAWTEDPATAPMGKAMPKIDGLKQVTGEAQYVSDIPVPAGCLHAAPVHATKVGSFTINTALAQGMPGFVRVLTAKDVPQGMGKGYPTGELLASDKTNHLGQLVAVALATTHQYAVNIAKAVEVSYSNVSQPVLTCAEALKAGGRVLKGASPPIKLGDVDKALASADLVFDDTFEMGAQYHYHLETQSVLAVPGSEAGTITLHSATQMPNVCAQTVAACLGYDQGSVELRNRRCGGGFGGKLGNSMAAASAGALAAVIAGQPVRMIWEYADNFAEFGTRPGWHVVSKIGCKKDGTVTAVRFHAYVNAGWTDKEVGFSELAFMGSFDNCYNIPNWDVQCDALRTELPWNTSMRGPGWTPGIYLAEHLMSAVAAHSGVAPSLVRERNFYQKGQVTPYGMPLTNWTIPDLMAKAKESAQWETRLQQVADFNKRNRWIKKGLSIVPSKFGVGYAATVKEADTMFDTLVRVNRDATVSVMTGGTEIGQGLTTKVAQVVAYNLGCPVEAIRILEQNTSVLMPLGCSDVTGGSVGSEMACRAAKNSCDKITAALAPVRKLEPKAAWAALVAKAYSLGVSLSAHETSTGSLPPVNPAAPMAQEYNTYGVAVVEATLDVLTGQADLTRADVVYDLGRSVNPDVDIGQVEGAFVMGLGLAATEDIVYDAEGKRDHIYYIPPSAWESPGEFHVTLLNAPANKYTVGGGKAVGEPPLTCSYALVEAISLAADAARSDAGMGATVAPQTPVGPERRSALCAVTPSMFALH
eukprot:TRINITY_DN398_c0_g4_i1.p1 TRINITY_DN398_c0_g4~~TRINITY_DN398_c0_g4_i1.p1  ORF type:complete len:1436 (+),score=507.05 TRINITY_DN398_c0_g4_i1:109-4308(+)